MVHGNKSEQQKRRKLQLIKAAKKYNASTKGKKRSKKYEKTKKAVKRRHRYRHSIKGKETRWALADRKREQRKERRKQQEKIDKKNRLQEREKKQKQEWRWWDMHLKSSEDPYYLGRWIVFQRKRWKEIFGTDDYFDETNEQARGWEEHYLKKERETKESKHMEQDEVDKMCEHVDSMNIE